MDLKRGLQDTTKMKADDMRKVLKEMHDSDMKKQNLCGMIMMDILFLNSIVN